MQLLRKSQERGYFDHDWLKTYHSFSFADYYDQRFMGFRDLRVINEDTVAGGAGFPLHGHQDMEILTYILEGELQHRDTLGNQEVIRPFELQRMTAGKGIRHAEFNHSEDKPVHLLQIWIMTEKEGLVPGYEQKNFKDKMLKQKITLVANHDGKEGSLKINQDVNVYVGRFDKNQNEKIQLANKRHAWVQVARGSLQVNGTKLEAGDGLALSAEPSLEFQTSASNAEFLFFDLK